MFEKYSSTKFHEIPSMRTDGQTEMTKLIVPFRNLKHLIKSHFCLFYPNTESDNNTTGKFLGNSSLRSRSKTGGQQTKE